MNTIYEATVRSGQVVLPDDVHLLENSKVLVVAPEDKRDVAGRIASPRFAYPEQAKEFVMDVREIADAGV